MREPLIVIMDGQGGGIGRALAETIRAAHPELSLAQLAALCDPPVTKSSLSHRLRKLIQLSQEGE